MRRSPNLREKQRSPSLVHMSKWFQASSPVVEGMTPVTTLLVNASQV
jgi:hypothetical protein